MLSVIINVNCPFTTFHLQAHTQRPNVLDLERGLLTYELALIPRLAMNTN